MADEFFDEQPQEGAEPQEQQPQEVEKIKLGETEYTQEELTRLVGLGKIGDEAEKKFHTKIDRVWPNFQQTIAEKKALEDKVKQFESRQAEIDRLANEEAAKRQNQDKAEPKQLTPEQIKAEALKQAEELGIGPKAMRQMVMEVIQGQQLLGDINAVLDEATEDGLPQATVEDVIKHMQDTGIRNPQKAYRDMFEDEYLEHRATKLAEIKKTKGIPTITQTTAGGKFPIPEKITKDNLDKVLADFVSSRVSN